MGGKRVNGIYRIPTTSVCCLLDDWTYSGGAPCTAKVTNSSCDLGRSQHANAQFRLLNATREPNQHGPVRSTQSESPCTMLAQRFRLANRRALAETRNQSLQGTGATRSTCSWPLDFLERLREQVNERSDTRDSHPTAVSKVILRPSMATEIAVATKSHGGYFEHGHNREENRIIQLDAQP